MARRGKTGYGTLKPVTKPGTHGTLYLYSVPYTPDHDLAPTYQWTCFAYSAEHAAERFDESNADDGYERTGEAVRVYRYPLAE